MFKQGSFRHSSIQGLRQGALGRWRRVDPGGLIHGPEARRPTLQTLVIALNLKSVAWAVVPGQGVTAPFTDGDTEVQRWEMICLRSHSTCGAEPGAECTSTPCSHTSRFSVNRDWVVEWSNRGREGKQVCQGPH